MKKSKELAYSKDQKFWVNEIEFYEKKAREWEERGKKIIRRYKDEREVDNTAAKFNILWSNTQTLLPALYAKPPKPNIERRFQDDDEVGLVSSMVLERAVSYYVDNEDFDYTMRQVVLDNLLPGRGTAWVRYVPTFGETTVTEDEDENKELIYEDVAVDYVHWEDFGHCWARTWEETRAVWRKVYLSKDKATKRFGKAAKKLSFSEKGEDGNYHSKKACVYEIWDKVGGKVLWVSKDADDILEEMDAPIKLKGFFPCPKPLFATIANDNLIPTPYYVQYQDQACELDELTARISAITDAIKVVGVYDASVQGLEKILSSGAENKMIPVDSWAMLAEKGGLNGAVDFFPIKEVVDTLLSLYKAREQVKQDLYEITGISDVIRGATKANETATAQQIKGQFATLRLDSMQEDVARFARDLVRIIAEIVAELFEIDTLREISGVQLLTAEEKQLYSMAASSGEQLPENVVDGMDKPTWQDIEALIRNDMIRCFRIAIETDSTIKADQEAEKAQRVEFLTAVSQFLDKAINLPPEMVPLAGEMLLFGVRGFKSGRQLEQEVKTAVEAMRKKTEQPPPEEGVNQAEIQIKQMDLELKKMDVQMKQMELQAKDKDIQIKQMEGFNRVGAAQIL